MSRRKRKVKMLFKLLLLLLLLVGIPLILMGFLLSNSSKDNIVKTSSILNDLSAHSIKNTGQKLVGLAENIINQSNENSINLSNKTLNNTSDNLIKLSQKTLQKSNKSFEDVSVNTIKDTGENLIKLSQENLKQAIITSNMDKAKSISDKIKLSIDNAIELFTIFTHLNEIKKMDSSSPIAILTTLEKNNPEIMHISLINKSGQVVLKVTKGSVYTSENTNFSSVEGFSHAISGKVYVSKIKEGQSPYVSLFIPVQQYVGKYNGVLNVDLSLSSIGKIINNTKIGKKGFAFAVNKSGQVVFHPAAYSISLKDNLSPIVNSVKSGKNWAIIKIHNQDYLCAGSKDDVINLTVIAAQPISEAFEVASLMRKQVESETSKSLLLLKQEASNGLKSANKEMTEEAQKSALVSKKIMLDETKNTLQKTVKQLRPVAEENTSLTVKQLQGRSAKEAAKAQKNIVLKSIILISIFVFIAGIIAFYIAKGIANPIQALTKIANIIANDDLSSKITNEDHEEEEIDDLFKSFGKMQTNLKQIISQIAHNSERVFSSSAELKNITEQASKATEQIALSATEVANGTETQTKLAKQSVEIAQELSDELNNITENIKDVSDLSLKASDVANEGNDGINKAITQMTIINDKVSASSRVIQVLANKSNEVNIIIELIASLAEQTNLLSLNAAIEAARAGEQAKGFVVIADQVRLLAQKSATSTKQVTSVIKEIQLEINNAVSSMNEGTIAVKEGSDLVNVAGNAFQNIQASVNNVSVKSNDVVNALQQIEAGKNQMVESINKISEISKIFAQNTQDVAAATEEQTAFMEEIASTANLLSNMSNELISMIKTFKLQ